MARRSEHSRAELREMAIAAAERIVQEEGVSGLTTRKVAAAMGYTVGTLYLVFENLDDLILAVNARTLDVMLTTLQASTEGCSGPRVCIKAIGLAYIRFASEERARWSLLYEHRMQDDTSLPDWFEARIQSIFTLVETQLRPLAPWREPSDVRLAARALWSGVHGICVLSLSDKLNSGGTVMVVALADALLEHFLTGYEMQPARLD